MNKRGLSMIITTLILIVLVLVAVAIIWVVVNNILKSGTEGIALGKFTLDAEIMSASLDNSSNNVSLTVKRNPGKGELSGMKFIFYDGANSEIVTEEDMTLKELGSRRFNFHLININVDNLIRISIVPIFKSESGKEIMGNIIDTYNVKDGVGCIANCTDKECGSDGCGGSCGDCVILHGDGWYCQSGTCIEGVNPCQLTSASWNETNVVEGTLVTLNVIGTNCAGIDLNYTIWEDDAVLNPDDFADSFIATGLGTTWTTEWQDDTDGGQSNPPEYYFIARVVGETEEVTSSAPLLTVTPLLIIICGDNIIEGTEVCDSTNLSGQTCVSQGYDSGTLACLSNCSGYDTSGCSISGELIAYYPFNGNATDASGNDNHGVVNGADCNVAGVVGQACSFDGIDDYVEILDNAILDGMNELSLCLWVNVISKSDWAYILSKNTNDFATSSYGIGLDNSADQIIRWSIRTSSGTASAATNIAQNLNQWYHICGVYDGSEVSIWENGIKQTTTDINSGSITDTSLPVKIGMAETSLNFNGIIDEVRIYNRALNQSEITDLSGIIITECNDGIDNDGDGSTDYPGDFGCSSSNDNDETNNGLTQCSDGIDNDADTFIDQDDSDCSSRSDDSESTFTGTAYYVRAGATGSNDGSDWTNAWTSLPSILERGAVYYIADGTYGSYTFDDAESGTEYIYIKKAIESDHGIDTGWSSVYGDGQAIFDNLIFNTGYWIFDGQHRNDWKTGYGFKATNNVENGKIVRINSGSSGYITLKYAEFENLRGTTPDLSDDGLYCPYYVDNINIQYTYWHELSRDILLMDNSDNVLVEYSQFTRNGYGHSQGLRFWGDGTNPSSNITIRYNRIENIVGTGYIILAWGNDNINIYGNILYRSADDTRTGIGTAIADISEPGERGVSNLRIYNNNFVNINGWNSGINIMIAYSDTNYAYNNIWHAIPSDGDPTGGTTAITLSNLIHENNYFSDCPLSEIPIESTRQVETGSPFVDWQNNDFHLAQTTDAGMTLPAPYNIDIDDNIRGADGIWDRGAYEYVA